MFVFAKDSEISILNGILILFKEKYDVLLVFHAVFEAGSKRMIVILESKVKFCIEFSKSCEKC